MTRLRVLAAAMIAAALSLLWPALALAQDATEVTLPVGDWVASAGAFIGPVLAAAALWLIRKLPAQLAAVAQTFRVEQLLAKAVDYAIAATVNATKDKPLRIDVGNEVVAKAVTYAITHGPGRLLEWLGGEELLRQKIIARLNVEATASLK